MSRREGRESDITKRLSSKLEREPSLKRPRRDGKPATERTSSSRNMDIADHTDRDRKYHRRLQDAFPLEAPLAPESNTEPNVSNREFDKKTNGLHEGTKHSSEPTEVPRFQSYFQHDERGSAGQGSRSFIRRATAERGFWSNPKDQSGEVTADKMGPYETQQNNESTKARKEDNNVWHHDGFFELEADAPPLVRKRPAFREKKMLSDTENAGVEATESVRPKHVDRPVSRNERWEERGGNYTHDPDRPERPFAGERVPPHRGETQRVGFPSRDRFGGGSSFRGRDRFTGRHEERNRNRPSGYHVEKWKHDLFDEANRSPTPKNEEDQIAKVEALLNL